jgi:hypothetical protein
MRYLILFLCAIGTIWAQPVHIKIASGYIGVQEKTGKNDGPVIETMLKRYGFSKGTPYCAVFVSWVLDSTERQTGSRFTHPVYRGASSRSFISKGTVAAKWVLSQPGYRLPPGSIVGWKRGSTPFGHVGFVVQHASTNRFITIEANTSPGEKGSQRDGNGIWQRTRSIQPFSEFRITDFVIPISVQK